MTRNQWELAGWIIETTSGKVPQRQAPEIGRDKGIPEMRWKASHIALILLVALNAPVHAQDLFAHKTDFTVEDLSPSAFSTDWHADNDHAMVSKDSQHVSVSWNLSHLAEFSGLVGDFDGDNEVGLSDFVLFLDLFGATASSADWDPRFDLDSNGEVGLSDFVLFLDNFGRTATANSPPVADAGPDQAVPVGSTVQVDGSGSTDAEGDQLSYSWIAPEGVTLSDSTRARPTFTASVGGRYRISLVVNDGIANSEPDEVVVTVGFIIQNVSFSTEDNLILSGGWTLPNIDSETFPVVILLHSLGSNRDNWLLSPLTVELLEEGYAVLWIDFRGHGHSEDPGGRSCDLSSCTLTIQDLENMPLDVKGALAWLSAQSEVDTSRIALIGEDLGANIAYISSGSFSQIKTTVSISPIALQNTSTGETLLLTPRFVGADVESFSPNSIFFVASRNDTASVFMASIMFQRTSRPRTSGTVRNTDAHGIQITLISTESRNGIRDWIRLRLGE